ncbi:MAG TPA: hypothetical protein ENN80_11930, partial [Candidatus Hydrogenedentes bacterium]|nr:hypothetical protein [Candidatus Hydrogenedentota bacterium]
MQTAERRGLWAGGFLLFAGLALLFTAAWRERAVLDGSAWPDLLIAVEADSVPEGALPLRSRPLSKTNLPAETQQLLEDMRMRPGSTELLDMLGITHMERLLMVEAEPAFFTPGLVSGRLPEPGRPEVLAGALVRFDRFKIDGRAFEVVGRLDAAIPGVLTAYFLPAHPNFEGLFAETEETTTGWLDPTGLDHLDSFGLDRPENSPATRFLMPTGQLPAPIAAVTLVGMALVAAGGAMIQIGLLRRYAHRAGALLGPFLHELTLRPRLLLAMHLLLYGAFFASMVGAFLEPRTTWSAVRFVRLVFAEGELEYIGRAYLSGNILHATLATLNQNYVVATCTYTILPSFVIPFAGVVKNLVSFTFVGLVMSPLWTGTAAQNTYHSIT